MYSELQRDLEKQAIAYFYRARIRYILFDGIHAQMVGTRGPFTRAVRVSCVSYCPVWLGKRLFTRPLMDIVFDCLSTCTRELVSGMTSRSKGKGTEENKINERGKSAAANSQPGTQDARSSSPRTQQNTNTDTFY